jgi:hypothetical protein
VQRDNGSREMNRKTRLRWRVVLCCIVVGTFWLTLTACPSVVNTPTPAPAGTSAASPSATGNPTEQTAVRTPAPTGVLATPDLTAPGKTLPPPLPAPSARPPQLPPGQTVVPSTPGTAVQPTPGTGLPTPGTTPYPPPVVPQDTPEVLPYPSPQR